MSRRPDDYKTNNYSAVNDEVRKLFRSSNKSTIDKNKISELISKYQDSAVVEAIQQEYYSRYEKVNKIAKKLIKKVTTQFDGKNIPLHSVLSLVKKAGKKYNLQDFEFAELKRKFDYMYYSGGKIRANDDSITPHTLMHQLFGDPISTDGLTIRDSDHPALQQILKMHSVTKSTHNQIILQNLQYESCAAEVKNAVFDSTRHNTINAINPLLIAMFVPKIEMFEQRFLIANLSSIIKRRYERTMITEIPDMQLLHSLIFDARDIICSSESAISDISLRCSLQNNMWNSVLALRSGNFFDPISNDFFNSVNECKVSSYDAPDLPVVGDEIVILNRVLFSFAFNPLIVQSEPMHGVSGVANPMSFPVIHNRISMRPYILVRLDVQETTVPKSLTEQETTQIFLENGGQPVGKKQVVSKSYGVLIFVVPRRSSYAKNSSEYMLNFQPKFYQVPTHVISGEKLNVNPVDFQEVITMGETDHYFRSCLFLETPIIKNPENDELKKKMEKMVLGTSAMVACYQSNVNFTSEYKIYAPKLLLRQSQLDRKANNQYNVFSDVANMGEFEDITSRRATVFIYSNDKM